MKKIMLVALACLAILGLAGCTDDVISDDKSTAISDNISPQPESTTEAASDEEGTQDVLESIREEFGRTPDMTYYTYYYGDNVPEEILNPSTTEEPTPW